MTITTVEALRTIYSAPQARVIKKQLAAIDAHCRVYIERSPFLILATVGASGMLDVSPRGGVPGFVKVVDEQTLLIPDAPGNNRLDSLENIIHTGRIGLLCLIPGIDETLRVNGTAVISQAPQDLERCADDRRTPKAAIRVSVEEAYLHCAKAFMRSRLWSADSRIDRASLPTMGQMINDQTGVTTPAETQADMIKRYAPDL